ncbi:MAG: hypothetical protein J1E02_05500 [Coprobacter sp.]|nr:hypothetical protein [Coprobacter sp.]
MMTLLLFIKHRCPGIWRLVERANGHLFALRYPHVGQAVSEVLPCSCDEFEFSTVTADDIAPLSAFLNRQPAERLEYFAPHPFDAKTLTRLHRNRAFILMKITHRPDGTLAGYFFLRCFFVGKAFHGLIADSRFSGRGLGKAMWALSAQICRRAGLRMQATVSEHNPASLNSARKATEVTLIGKLSGGYLRIECKTRKDETAL